MDYILEGVVNIGNAGITRKLREKGIDCTLCMMEEENGEFIDFHLTREQLLDLKEKIEHHLALAREESLWETTKSP